MCHSLNDHNRNTDNNEYSRFHFKNVIKPEAIERYI